MDTDAQTSQHEPSQHEPSRQKPAREPVFSAPWLVVFMTLLLIALHGATYLLSDSDFVKLQYDYAVVPRRFWEEGQLAHGYPNIFAALITLVSTGFLHAGWLHVLVNAAMLLAFGAQTRRAMGPGAMGDLKWMLLFLGSIVGGSIGYLAAVDVTGPAAVGASGGTSGLMAAAFILDPYGRTVSPLSRGFLVMTVAFAIANLLLVFAGPALIGSGIAWQAHLGGYVAGALLMLALAPRRRRAEELRPG